MPILSFRIDCIQLADPFQGFISRGCRGAGVHIVDLTAGGSPASGFRYPPIAIQLVESGICIRLQHTTEGHKMVLRVDAFSVGVVGESNGWCQR